MIRTFARNNNVYYNLHDIYHQYVNSDFFSECKTIRQSLKKNNIAHRDCIYVFNDKTYPRRFTRAEVYVDSHVVRDHDMLSSIVPQKSNIMLWILYSILVFYGLPLCCALLYLTYHRFMPYGIGLIC